MSPPKGKKTGKKKWNMEDPGVVDGGTISSDQDDESEAEDDDEKQGVEEDVEKEAEEDEQLAMATAPRMGGGRPAATSPPPKKPPNPFGQFVAERGLEIRMRLASAGVEAARIPGQVTEAAARLWRRPPGPTLSPMFFLTLS